MSDVEQVESKIPLDELVNTYLKIRNKKDALYQEYKKTERELKAGLDQIEQVMLGSLNEVSADSIKTSGGTIIKTLKENFVCSDWTNFKDFVLEHECLELFQQRIHQANFKEFLSSRTDDGLPPGISSMREFNIVVRKPTSK